MHNRRMASESEIYHVMCRGVGRQIIFEDDIDREYLLKKIRGEKKGYRVTIYAWCFMDNHIHLLVSAEIESLGSFMRKVLSAYALFFNKRHDRVGHLFQDRFLSVPVESEGYFLEIIRYIHQNPIGAGIKDFRRYPWSSYSEYLGESDITATDMALEMLDSLENFDQFNQILVEGKAFDLGSGAASSSLTRASYIARDELGDVIQSLKSLPRDERDRCIERLLTRGMSIRQIEKLTGIGRGIVSRISAHMQR